MDSLDAYIARFQNLPSVMLHQVHESGQDTVAWHPVEMHRVVADLVANELTVPAQLQVVTAEIQKWGRLAALARRVWQISERIYRAWRSQFYLESIDAEGKPSGWKKPTETALEAMYRTQPEYHRLQAEVERAEEAFNTVDAILQAFRAKKDVLLGLRRRYHEDGAAGSVS